VRPLEALVIRDARKAIAGAETQRKELLRSQHVDPQHLASLYAVEAQAYSELDLDAAARAAALTGLALVRAPADSVHLNLLSTYAENQFDEEGLGNAVVAIEDARSLQPKGSPGDTCLLMTLGQIQHYQGRDDLAIGNLIQAYRASAQQGMADTRPRVAAALAVVLLSMGDLDQALALNQDVIDWDTANGATQRLSESRFRRGEILARKHDYQAALGEFGQVRQLSVVLQDEQGIGFADLRACEVYIELTKLEQARTSCNSALHVFTASHSVDMAKEASSFLARIDLAEGRTWRALVTLNRVLDHGGSDISQARLTEVYRLRAQANATLENYRDAYADISHYVERYTASNDADRARNAAALRARFGADREAEHNLALRNELALEREGADRQRDRLRWAAASAVAALLIIALLAYVLVTNVRHRRKLQELAMVDGLTGLPNRRRTAEVAIGALAKSAATFTPLTIAIIDFDHFKGINDRCGHATGDQVLRDFARMSRELLRPSDTLGRWGGEEFLLVMPDTPLDVALHRVETLREAALTIPLPPTALDYHVSLSAGLATSDEGVTSLDDIIARADVALYEAKNEGRDLVRIADVSYRMASTGTRRALRHR
jgi:diguanylate cyclase (GGDEF)-like protein